VAAARIDRAKHHVDILERVCKGAQARQADRKIGFEPADVRIKTMDRWKRNFRPSDIQSGPRAPGIAAVGDI
jgi:hypothetical protein